MRQTLKNSLLYNLKQSTEYGKQSSNMEGFYLALKMSYFIIGNNEYTFFPYKGHGFPVLSIQVSVT